jgi:multiple antibiotic resistance protein
MTILSATIILFLVMDPFGNVPLFLSVLKSYDGKKQRKIILRESIIAFLILMFFLLTGEIFLNVLGISGASLSIAGGIILFIIALKMIFSSADEIFKTDSSSEPFVVPLAIPLVAGPSTMASVMLLCSREPSRLLEWATALFIACLMSTAILFFSLRISKTMGKRGLTTLEKLMGLILAAVSVQMLLAGIREFVLSLNS